MRLTPAQMAVHLICGEHLPILWEDKETCIIEGRRMLIDITGKDYGYDLQKWHDHLKESREGGYTWQDTIDLPKVMKEALASKEWHEVVQRLPEEIETERGKLKKAAELRRLRKLRRDAS